VKPLLLAVLVLAATGCGRSPARLGVLVNDLGVKKSYIGSPSKEPMSGSYVPGSSRRFTLADVLGDDSQERLVELPSGAGLEILDLSDHLLATIRTPDYLTHFATMPSAAGSRKQLIVVYTYPNSHKGGTFRVLNGAQEQLATWDELPAAPSFAVGEWDRQPALFYLRADDVVVRSREGRQLRTFRVPEGQIYRDVLLRALPRDRIVIIASGNGYTQYHMVCVFDAGRLVFQDVAKELAYAVETTDDGAGFVVTARDGQWKYATQ
jgi:hypothetical protein